MGGDDGDDERANIEARGERSDSFPGLPSLPGLPGTPSAESVSDAVVPFSTTSKKGSLKAMNATYTSKADLMMQSMMEHPEAEALERRQTKSLLALQEAKRIGEREERRTRSTRKDTFHHSARNLDSNSLLAQKQKVAHKSKTIVNMPKKRGTMFGMKPAPMDEADLLLGAGTDSEIIKNTEDAPSSALNLTGSRRKSSSWKVSAAWQAEENSGSTLNVDEQGDFLDEELVTTSLRKQFVVLPDNRYRVAWDVLILVLVIYNAIKVPMDMAFLDGPDPLEGFENFTTALFWFDILLNFFTGFRVEGKLVLNLRLIAKHYLTSWFLIDLCSSIPVDQFFLEKSSADEGNATGVYSGVSANLDSSTLATEDLAEFNRLLKLVRILKLLRVLRMARIMTRLQKVLHVNLKQIAMVVLFVIMMFVWHWLSCAYVDQERERERERRGEGRARDTTKQTPNDRLCVISRPPPVPVVVGGVRSTIMGGMDGQYNPYMMLHADAAP